VALVDVDEETDVLCTIETVATPVKYEKETGVCFTIAMIEL
jgi:hypothetical protein